MSPPSSLPHCQPPNHSFSLTSYSDTKCTNSLGTNFIPEPDNDGSDIIDKPSLNNIIEAPLPDGAKAAAFLSTDGLKGQSLSFPHILHRNSQMSFMEISIPLQQNDMWKCRNLKFFFLGWGFHYGPFAPSSPHDNPAVNACQARHGIGKWSAVVLWQ